MRHLLLILFIVSSSSVFAHLGDLSGVVYDDNTKLPLQGVSIQLTGLNKGVITNELGQFRFKNLVAAPYKVEVSHLGFKTQLINVTVQEDQNTAIRVSLSSQPLQLNEVTVPTSRPHDQQLISGLDIKLRPITNSQEILRMVPGLFIGQHAGGGKAEQIFLRGFDLDHGTDIKIMVDDMPVNMVSHAHGQGYADLHFVIPELTQGVDFRKGSYNTDKGNLATAGWVNFRTRNTLERSFLKIEGGQFDTYRVVGGLDLLGQKGKANNQSAYVASEYSYSNSYFDNPQNFKRLNLIGKYHGHISPNTNLSFTASTFWSKWNHSGQIPDRSVADGSIGFFGSIDPTEGGETSRTNVNVQLVSMTPQNHIIKNQFFYTNYNFELYSNFTFFKEDSINGDQIRQKEKRSMIGYNGSFTLNHSIGKSDWTTIIGVQYRQDITTGTELSRTKDRTTVITPLKLGNINELNAAIYVDESVKFSERFSLNIGVRFDYFNNRYEDLLLSTNQNIGTANASIVSPKLNLYYTFSPKLQLYLNTGKGFHSNDTRVVVPQGGLEILPATYGSDFGVIYKPFSRLLINVASWYLWSEQEFVYVGDEGVVEPNGRSRRYGIDLSARYQLSKTLYADIDLNTATPRALDAEAGKNLLPLAPTFTTAGGLSLQTPSGWSGSLRYRYISDRPANEDNSIVAEGYFVNDLQLNYSKNRYNVGLSIQNIFDVRWKETQFNTESRLRNEAQTVEEIHFTPGTPLFARLSLSVSL
jgi:outer membrane cobalamin receptor